MGCTECINLQAYLNFTTVSLQGWDEPCNCLMHPYRGPKMQKSAPHSAQTKRIDRVLCSFMKETHWETSAQYGMFYCSQCSGILSSCDAHAELHIRPWKFLSDHFWTCCRSYTRLSPQSAVAATRFLSIGPCSHVWMLLHSCIGRAGWLWCLCWSHSKNLWLVLQVASLRHQQPQALFLVLAQKQVEQHKWDKTRCTNFHNRCMEHGTKKALP